jgi:Ser-tRNA(Ala) deacylase AlaX
MQQSFSEKTGSTDISLVNASFVPLSNTDANQIKANVEYTLEKEKMQNQLVNMVMEVYASNGSLIRTTSIGGGFRLQSNGGEHLLRTSINDKTLEDVSIKILLTDLSKKIPLSNTITKHLKLERP